MFDYFFFLFLSPFSPDQNTQFAVTFAVVTFVTFINRCCASEPRKVLPILKTDEPICPEGKLSCGNGECIEKELFCNGKPDCKDESDENACSKYHKSGEKFTVKAFGNEKLLAPCTNSTEIK